MENKRTEKDTLGGIEVPFDVLYGAQTKRAMENFPDHPLIPWPIIEALLYIKIAAAETNKRLKRLDARRCSLIKKAAEKILQEKPYKYFRLGVFQSGSGTQTNMNVNEAISTLANEIADGKRVTKGFIHPNDHVNMGQSTNDVFPAAMHIAAILETHRSLIPALSKIKKTLKNQSRRWSDVIKCGRTHLMDALPITFGMELESHLARIKTAEKKIKDALRELFELPLGGTAVGTGINTAYGFDSNICKILSEMLHIPLKPASTKSYLMSSHDPLLSLSSSIERCSQALFKLADDIRWMASGPRCGLSELKIPANEPGSSIMPGKVNPTQSESVIMGCLYARGMHHIVMWANTESHFQLNTAKPLIIFALLEQIKVVSMCLNLFNDRCLSGIEPDMKKMKRYAQATLMSATVLAPLIGYDRTAELVDYAKENGLTIVEAANELGINLKNVFDLNKIAKGTIKKE